MYNAEDPQNLLTPCDFIESTARIVGDAARLAVV